MPAVTSGRFELTLPVSLRQGYEGSADVPPLAMAAFIQRGHPPAMANHIAAHAAKLRPGLRTHMAEHAEAVKVMEKKMAASAGPVPLAGARLRLVPASKERAEGSGWRLRDWALIALFYGCYSANTISLTAFDATNTARQVDSVLALSDQATGSLLGLGSTAYLVGKFTAGPIADSLGGPATIVLSLALSAASLTFLSVSRGITSLKGGWMVARYAQAAAWPGVMIMVKSAFMDNGMGSAVGLVSTSSRFGAIVGNLAIGSLLGAGRSWRAVLRLAAVWSLVIGALVVTASKSIGSTGAPTAAAADAAVAAAPEKKKSVSFGKFLSVLARSPRIWLIYGSNVFVTPVFQVFK